MERLSDKAYTRLFQTLETAENLDPDSLTILHCEQDYRAAEYWSGQRTRQSVKASKLVQLINFLQTKHNCTLVYHARPYYYSVHHANFQRFAWASK